MGTTPATKGLENYKIQMSSSGTDHPITITVGGGSLGTVMPVSMFGIKKGRVSLTQLLPGGG